MNNTPSDHLRMKDSPRCLSGIISHAKEVLAIMKTRAKKKQKKIFAIKSFLSFLAFVQICMISPSYANKTNMNNILTPQQQQIAAAAACAAKGDQTGLKTALATGLDSGVTVNEFKEVLVQLYAYCGFPRSLNALNTYMQLLKERGGKDAQGKLPGPLPKGTSLEYGTANQTKLTGRIVKGEIFEFAPAIDEYLKTHLFGDIFARDNLDWQTREIATIAMLAAMNGVESQLNSHIAVGKHNGLSDEQVKDIVTIAMNVGSAISPPISPFSTGEENTAYAQYFSGKSWLVRLSTDKKLGVPLANVTFEPGCRNNWHSHTGGQILIAVGGTGYYQERGKASRRLEPGDIVEITPNVEHWHGAAPNSWFSHLAIECHPETNKNTWLEPVSDSEYQTATVRK